jgi:hypothetical protein
MSGESSEVFASASVLVDGCRVPELEDKDGPRDWDWLAWTLPEREVASVRNCDNQHQRLIATTTGDYFEILLTNDQFRAVDYDKDRDGNLLRFAVYVDGVLIINYMVSPQVDAVVEGQLVATAQQTGVRRMRFAPLRPESKGAGTDARSSQAGRIDIIVRKVFSSEPAAVEAATFAPPPDTSLAATLGNAEKKRVFGQEAAFDDKVESSLSIGSIVRMFYDKDNVLATFSWRYAAIEGLQIAKTNPKAWQDWQWHQIEAARVASRELRKSLRGGFAVTEPPSYLFSSRLSPLAGAGAPRAIGDAAALDAALRGEGFKLAGAASSFFAACSRQLCGTAGLAGYVEHAVIEELVTCERFPRDRADHCSEDEFQTQQDEDFEYEYGHLFRSSRSPIKTAKEWLAFVQARRAAHDGAMAANQIYDDDLARSNDPPPLVPFDHVLVRAAQGSDVDYEAVVLAAGSTDTEVRVKEVGSARTETLSRNSKRLGAGLASRRGAAVAEMQVEIFAQAFSNVFGVMLYLLMVAGADKKLRVVRVMPRPGRRVLINGIAVAHLGGAFDSIERHNEIIEIQSGDESDEDDAPPAPAPPPRKKSRTSKFAKVKADPGAVKSERRA